MRAQLKNMVIISTVLLSITAIPANAMVETSTYGHAIHDVGLMDLDGNGRVSNEEYTRFYEGSFEAMDVNRDQVLKIGEWSGNQHKHEVALATGGYQNQVLGFTGEDKIDKKAFLEYHRSFVEATNQKRAQKEDPQTWLARRIGG